MSYCQVWLREFTVQFHGTVQHCKAARFCCPVQVQALNPTADSLEEFRNFPFTIDDATIANLAQRLPLYLAAADGGHSLMSGWQAESVGKSQKTPSRIGLRSLKHSCCFSQALPSHKDFQTFWEVESWKQRSYSIIEYSWWSLFCSSSLISFSKTSNDPYVLFRSEHP